MLLGPQALNKVGQPHSVMERGRRAGAPAAPSSPFTWDTATAPPHVVLSNSDRTFTVDNEAGWVTVRSLIPKSSGKWYCELVVDDQSSPFYWFYGLCDSGFNLINYLGSSEKSVGWAALDFSSPTSASFTPTSSKPGSRPATGGRMQQVFDLDTGKGWMGHSGTISGDPAAGTDPWITFAPNLALYIAATIYGQPGYSATLTLPASIVHTAPSGFSVLNA